MLLNYVNGRLNCRTVDYSPQQGGAIRTPTTGGKFPSASKPLASRRNLTEDLPDNQAKFLGKFM